MKLNFNQDRLGRFCREHGIARLELFGSALGDDFRDGSDVDLLATLRTDAHPTLLDWADMQEKLAELFGRPVDLVSRRAIERSRNRYRKHSILTTATPIYAEDEDLDVATYTNSSLKLHHLESQFKARPHPGPLPRGEGETTSIAG